jgi:hypothetical protein
MLKRHEVEILLKAGRLQDRSGSFGGSFAALGQAHSGRSPGHPC